MFIFTFVNIMYSKLFEKNELLMIDIVHLELKIDF